MLFTLPHIDKDLYDKYLTKLTFTMPSVCNFPGQPNNDHVLKTLKATSKFSESLKPFFTWSQICITVVLSYASLSSLYPLAP